ncbi:hypothetical protein ABZ589_23810 [Streptomyces sp. NPDC013313]|uniref:hypothetical protein n=1 Tax=Streptomyces sp. NPDC013313 TaxID=3155603 RepID=UPI0033D24707
MTARHWWWVGLFTGLALLALTVVAFGAGLEVADQVGGVTGGVFGAGSFALSIVSALALRTPPTTSHRPSIKASGPGSIAAGGDATGNAIGARSVVTGRTAPASTPTPSPRRPASDLEATDGGLAAGGNAHDNATGTDSRREIQ